ncbi:MAG: hypothetical protein ACREIU_05310 [Planctomycetota bacterium]
MSRLTVVLRYGFERDRVQVLVDGAVVYDRADVKTRHQIDRADAVELDVAEGERLLEVRLADRGLSRKTPLTVAGNAAVEVSVDRSTGIEVRTAGVDPRDA